MTRIDQNIESIRTNMGITRAEMADRMDITLDRYNRLANGESKMLAVELVKLHEISGVPYENILIITP